MNRRDRLNDAANAERLARRVRILVDAGDAPLTETAPADRLAAAALHALAQNCGSMETARTLVARRVALLNP
jgi:hypothetical protein